MRNWPGEADPQDNRDGRGIPQLSPAFWVREAVAMGRGHHSRDGQQSLGSLQQPHNMDRPSIDKKTESSGGSAARPQGHSERVTELGFEPSSP